jgi:polysaccharide export outer membrane protein
MQRAPSGYTLGPGDVVMVQAADAEELTDRRAGIDKEGYVNLPQAGRIRAAGLTLPQLEAEIVERLKPLIQSPQVVVTAIQWRIETVLLMGAFIRSGTYPYEPKWKLSELLTMAGGLAPSANRRVKVTRRLEYGPIPLPTAIEDRDRGVSEAEIDVRRLMQNVSSAEDLLLRPSDVITATLKERVYVSGMVARPGALDLEDRDSLTVSQAIAIVGITPDAKIEDAVVLRPIMDTNRRSEIPVNAKKILQGRATDFPLLPNDVLVIPQKRRIGSYLLPIAAGMGSALIYVLVR